MVSHPENGSDSPIGSNRDRGRDTFVLKMIGCRSRADVATLGRRDVGTSRRWDVAT